ncbi:MAG: nucleoside monophosphate kinase [Caldimicrobium sp.]|nr:nucleoside monophosphate kinase [Caldimicrobium sp.]MCX7613814.1 nucleoside monophosphate kinase [Caldimicrobium sp.]MDW8182641.1 nucleoside monophosphate kinase [Caldimicrobium sp.]
MDVINALLLIGPTGSGKSPLGSELEKRGLWGKRVLHFDFGENLRKGAQGLLPLKDEERSLIKIILKEARLLKPEEFYLAKVLLHSFLMVNKFTKEDLLLLNGLPRNIYQASALQSFIRVTKLIRLDIDYQTLKIRILIDPAGDRSYRDDDDEDYLKRKLYWFERETLPLIDFYQKAETPCLSITVDSHDTGLSLYYKLVKTLECT